MYIYILLEFIVRKEKKIAQFYMIYIDINKFVYNILIKYCYYILYFIHDKSFVLKLLTEKITFFFCLVLVLSFTIHLFHLYTRNRLFLFTFRI